MSEQHTMRIMRPRLGDEVVTWDPENEEQVAAAKDKFDKALKEGGKAFRTEKQSVKVGEPLKEFDPSIGELIVVPHYAGG